MGQRGPQTESTALKLARGTYRPSRDGGRMDIQPPAGKPEKPAQLHDEGSELWDRITAEHEARGTLGAIDTAALMALCVTWTLACKTMPLAEDNPVDKDVRCSLLGYLATCDKLGAKFGWTSSDRANLKLGGNAGQQKVRARERA